MNTFTARPMIESAILSAIGAVLVLLGFYVPLLGIVATLVAPLASALAVIRHDLRWGILSSVVTALALFPFLGWITAISLWTVFGLTGLFFGWALKRGFGPSVIIAVTAVAALLGTLAGVLEAYVVAGITPHQMVGELLETFRMGLEMNKNIFGENPALDQMMGTFSDTSTVLKMLPGALIIAALFQAYINFEVSRWVLPRLGERIDALPPFRRWMFPLFVAYGWLGALILTMYTPLGNVPLLLGAAQAISSSGAILLLVQAFSLVSFFLLEAGFPKYITGVALFFLYSLSSTQPLGTFVVLAGMMDILFDFRHIKSGEGSFGERGF